MKTFQDLQEGVYDPNILKAFFLAGGPGSGKSYVVKRGTGGLGMKIVNSDDVFEKYLKDAGLSMKMPKSEEEPRDKLRARAKQVTAARQANYIEGRLGLIIDGTGHDYDKIATQATKLKILGYDVHMIFVNTSLDVALARNERRPRSVPEDIVKKSWNQVQQNIGKFQQFFGNQNFIIVDNNDIGDNVFDMVGKQVRRMLSKKVNNPTAQKWIDNQLKLKQR